MAELRVTDGTVTCELGAGGNTVLEYLPRTGEGQARTVTEELRAALGGQGPETAREALARLMEQAGRVAAGSGEAPVYVEGKRKAAAPLYRSRLLRGSLLDLDGEGYWPARGQLRLAVRWLRQAWWEGPETEIALLGPAGDEQLGGMDVLCAAGPRGGGAYVDLAAVGGNLPAPLKLKFTNAATGYPVARLYAALRAGSQPITLAHLLEGEAARAGGTTQPPEIDERYSGGRYRALSWSGTVETRLIDWIVPGEQLAAAAGRWYRLIARCCPASEYTDLFLQIRITIDGTLTVWAGPWARASAVHEACDLGTLPLPPFVSPTSGLRALRLELWGRRGTTGTHSLNLDYLGLMALDGFRHYQALAGSGPGLENGCDLIDDGTAGEIYAHLADGDVSYWLADGEPLRVRPGCQHRLCLLWENADGEARADRPARVQVWYRPRVGMP